LHTVLCADTDKSIHSFNGRICINILPTNLFNNNSTKVTLSVANAHHIM